MKETSRQERIGFLRQQQERRHFLGDFLTALSNIIGEVIPEAAVMTLEETNAATDKLHYRESQAPTFRFTFPFTQVEKFREICSCLKPDLSDPDTYFATARFFNSFFLRLDSSFAIDKLEEIIELDNNSFYIFHKDFKNGLSVDSNEEKWTENGKTEYVWTYELSVWGKEWVDKIHFTYNKHT
ncbi:hypothetical protein [Adhaeribacter pallidiroseus]|uniref:Uncharacterized protein n=1 Tax=Adhaeribacter pallidiroseus TaxID=2072847 RepID=A0A369QC68_9BACT|nr:hypothetical protein [Adhaeribacter pallidiroseus]RDC62491.1 hypothetical protein AHMF7616_01085 [Adhaeribacter pallidiroseus]